MCFLSVSVEGVATLKYLAQIVLCNNCFHCSFDSDFSNSYRLYQKSVVSAGNESCTTCVNRILASCRDI